MMQLNEVHRATVQGGQVTITGVPLPDGAAVEVMVKAAPERKKLSIHEVRELLRGGVERYDQPFEPSIPEDSWEMLK
ncbi:MAG TPA: hypothetical protein VN541_00905 [Tepidisphaeraceae bacterium]|nr:hypothetical protein [Tepidisphaeraceae bacterium]